MKTAPAFLGLLILGAVLAGCNKSATPQTVDGETPIRYVICSVGDKDCILVARFVDFDTCETHKKISEMLCDSRSKPGTIMCTTDLSQKVAVSHCTQ